MNVRGYETETLTNRYNLWYTPRMKVICAFTVAVAILALPSASAGAFAVERSTALPATLPGSIIVALNETGADAALAEIAERYGATAAAKLFPGETGALGRVFELLFNPSQSAETLIRELGAFPNVRYAEPNYLYAPAIGAPALPNDPLLSQAWHLAKINAVPFLGAAAGQQIPVAVIDTGVKWDHPDLVNRIWTNQNEIAGNGLDDDQNGYVDDVRGWDFVNSPSLASLCWPGEDCTMQDNDPMDVFGHGTHVAGVLAAEANNGIGSAGVCGNCRVMPLRAGFALNAGYSYPVALMPSSAIAAAINYARQNGARVINMSFTGGYSLTMESVLGAAASQGILLVGAAGNGNTSATLSGYPAAYPTVLAVAATDPNDQRASFSNYGYWLDVAAPGTNIISTLPPGANLGYCADLNADGYDICSGTSFAAPTVAGLAGLALGRNPALTRNQLWTSIQSGTNPLSGPDYFGIGRVSAMGVLYPIMSGATPPTALFDESMSGASAAGGVLSVIGTASGQSFTSYRLEYGAGAYPSQWIVFHPATQSQITNGTLCAWNPAALGLPSGTYSLRLVVQSGTHAFEDRAVVQY